LRLPVYSHHPSTRIAGKLSEALKGHSIDEVSRGIAVKRFRARTDAEAEKIRDDISLLLAGDRGQYTRRKGHAAMTIDSVATEIGVHPYELFTDSIQDMRKYVLATMKSLMGQEGLLDKDGEKRLKSYIRELEVASPRITACWLTRAAREAGLPPWFFLANDAERESYTLFREEVRNEVGPQILKCIPKRFWGQLRRVVMRKYRHLLSTVDSDADAFINELYIRFVRIILDGNEAFEFDERRLCAYLRHTFVSLLQDYCRKRRVSETPVSQMEEDGEDFLEKRPCNTLEEARDIMTEILQEIADREERNALSTVLNAYHETDLRRIAAEKLRGSARKTLHNWAGVILARLGREFGRLPPDIQELLVFYAESRWATILEELLYYWEMAKQAHVPLKKVAGLLDLKKRTLENILYYKTIPPEATLDRIENHFGELEWYLESA
jgi:hypothetical protein